MAWGSLGWLLVSALLAAYALTWGRRRRRCVGFFHPYCNDGGGGERVLWCGVQALLEAYPDVRVVIYTGDVAPQEEILRKAQDRFGIAIDGGRLSMVRLRLRWVVEARCYPALTLLGQSMGTVVLALEALSKLVPTLFIDTMGCAFTYPVARYLFGCKVSCYTHYPTISTDMLSLVSRRETSYNNSAAISRSLAMTRLKLAYYGLFALLYGVVGRCAHTAMCNSSWTAAHIRDIWGVASAVLFPPCNTDKLQGMPLAGRERLVVSLGQFRPEKNHALQVRGMAELIKKGEASGKAARMAIVGSCRNSDDEARVAALRALIQELGLQGCVEVRVNLKWEELEGLLGRAMIGVHTMVNEHFGINVVEFMASGVIPVAHKSGGPKEDIVDEGVGGFLAQDAEEYATCMSKIFEMREGDRLRMQEAARERAKAFSDESFKKGFLVGLPSF